MTRKQIALAVVLFDFSALTAYAVIQYGVLGVYELVLANAVTVMLLTDLTIALSMVLVWLWQDARQRGISPLPYVALTLAFGSVGPLLYLIRRVGRDATNAAPSVLATHAHTARA